jgi:hypothetical protein
MKMLAITGDSGEPHSCADDLFIELAAEAEGALDMTKSPQDILLKMST